MRHKIGGAGWAKLALLAWLSLAAGAARAQTELTLNASGSAAVAPDEITATLKVQAEDPKAAAAQAAVNKAMQAALAAANKVQGVQATTGGYNVYQLSDDATPPNRKFQATQTLNLVMPTPGGEVPASFTALVGKLQQLGLLLGDLDGDLSAAGRAAAAKAATRDALRQIAEQAAAIAAEEKLPVGRTKSLNVNTSQPGPIIRPTAMLRMTANAAATPPQAAPDRITVQADVTAVIELGHDD